MDPFRLKTAPELQERMVNNTVARSELTDLSPGDPLMQLTGAVAFELEELYFDVARLMELFGLDEARGEDLDRRAAEVLPDGLERRPAARATGTLRWRTQLPVAVEVPIPAGTVAARAGTPRTLYVTTVPGRIAAGSTQSERADGTQGDIPAAATVAGQAGNAEVDTVTGIVTSIPNVVRVHNQAPFTGGVEGEADDELRARVRSHVRSLSRCIPEALRLRALAAEVDGRRVRAASVWEDPVRRGNVTVYVDDGSGTVAETAQAPAEVLTDPVGGALGGEQEFHLRHRPVRGSVSLVHTPAAGGARVLAAGAEYVFIAARGFVWLHPDAFPGGLAPGDRLAVAPYTHFTGLIREAQRLIDGDPADPLDTPAWRAAGVVVTVAAPTVILLALRGHVVAANDVDRAEVVAEVRRRLGRYVNGLGIGSPFIAAEAVARAMRVGGMVDFILEEPVSNRPAAFNQVIRLPSGNLSIT